jgi:hypothetical protein
MKLSTLVFVAVIGLAFADNLKAQATAPAASCPEKIDEFGHIDDRELSDRVARLFDRLRTNRETSAYVIAYAGADALPADRDCVPVFNRIRQLVTFRGYDDSRFVMIYGGFRKTDGAEFFLLASDADAPEPSWTVAQPEIPDGTFLWSKKELPEDSAYEFENRALLYQNNPGKNDVESDLPHFNLSVNACDTAGYDEEDEYVPEPIAHGEAEDVESKKDDTADLDDVADPDVTPEMPEPVPDARFDWIDKRFGEALLYSEDSTGVMIYYADDRYYDTARLHSFIEEARDRLAYIAHLDLAQIEVVFGGYRSRVEVEYWIVPPDGKPPEPKPGKR